MTLGIQREASPVEAPIRKEDARPRIGVGRDLGAMNFNKGLGLGSDDPGNAKEH